MKKFFSLIAAVLFAGSMMATEVTVSKTIEELATANSWANGTVVTPFALDEVITVSTNATDANTGKYYTSGQQVRLYQSGAAELIISAAEGYTISSITLTYVSQNTGIFVEAESGVAVDFENVQSATFTVGNSGEATNGQARVTSISVTYDDGGEVPPTPQPETIPTTAPAVPAQAEADVMAIYCNHYTTNNAHFGISGWAGAYQTLDLSGTAVGYWTDMTWECIIDPANTDAAHDFSAYENIHIDMWAPQAAKIKFTAEAFPGGGYKDGIVVNLAQGWNSLDFALSEFPGNYDFSTLKCFVFEQYQTPAGESFEHNPFAFANLYFWNTPALADPTNCAEAAAAALSVSANNELYNNGAVYTIEGYVTGIKTAYSDQYHNISFWMADAADGGEVLQAYRAACATEADAPKVGDKVAVTGSLTKYGTTPEFAAGCTYVITEPYIPVEPEINYYVAGSMGVWGPDEAYRLTPNNQGLYEGEFTFAANDEFKVIGYDGTTVTWFPEGMNNNYVITEAGDYKITFNPAGNVEGWYAGFFNVVKKEAPIVHQYEVAEAIAAGLQENDEVLVRGVITKMEFKGANFAKYGSVNIYVADATDAEGEFEFFNCYSLNADTFRTSIPNYDPTDKTWVQLREVADANGNAIHVGDTVIAFGKYKLYNSTHELNTGCYLVDIKPAPVAPAQDVEVTLSSLTNPGVLVWTDAVAEDGWWQIMGGNEAYDFSISNVSTTETAGVYTVADLDADYSYISVYGENDTTDVAFVDGSVTVAVSTEGIVTVNGTLVGTDGNNYIFNLTYKDPTAEKTVNVNIQNAELIDYYADYGLYGVYGTDANDIYVQIAIWAEKGFQGEFTEKDFDHQYIGSAIFEGEEQVNIYTAAITVTPGNGGDYNITATLLCYNNKQYNVTMYVPAGETAIENVDAAVKAIKRLVNGNLIIEKGNKTYNMTGVRIR